MSALDDRVILVTGGTGSFGHRFIRTVLAEHRPRKVIVFSRDELKQTEMRRDVDDPRIRFFIGDVRDRERLYRAFRGVDVVVHAAALKQVPACEYNPFEAVKTNVMGTANVVDAAIDCRVKRVMVISTDKAVNPINIYGATKLVAEKLAINANAYAGDSGTRFSVVRYGNVVGTRGSVVPIFTESWRNGTVPITDERMTRFWITLDQGVRFVVNCLEAMQGGEIFVPKVPSMRVVDLAETLAPGCRIEIIGIRPGEKLHEVLIHADEARRAIDCRDFYVIMPEPTAIRIQGWEHGRPVPADFLYSSDRNEWWLTPGELKEMVAVLPDDAEE